jgi:hypothetical protein
MKKPLLYVLTVLAVGALAYHLMRSHRITSRNDILLDSMPELTWIKTELKASDAQMEKVTELHIAYRPKCEEMCKRIAVAHEKVIALARLHRVITPELHAAIRDHATTHAECQQAMLEHIYLTAQQLEPAQATRYIETVLPIALEFTRSGHASQQ